jgi:hypothetical protein
VMLGRWGVGQGGHGGARKDGSRRRIVWKWARVGHGERKQLHTYYSVTPVCLQKAMEATLGRLAVVNSLLVGAARQPQAQVQAGLRFSAVAQAYDELGGASCA